MHESEKSNALRPAEFFRDYLGGKLIDIGSGKDPVTAQAEPFDINEGDANEILKFRPAESYDCVYSSHCLEHMKDPRSALQQWWALIRPGGYLVLIVPHEDLYEQGYWPSLFNWDHKATFRLARAASWSPVSNDLHELVASMPGAEIVSEKIQDHGYDHRLQGSGRTHIGSLRRLANNLIRFNAKRPGLKWLTAPLQRLLALAGTPADQTLGFAQAQIEMVARKKP
jgi:SAM-dependent methyltransferase